MSDVAKLAGVSHQTVSRVLNTPEAVRESTRERVVEAMTTLGYRPNLAARALASSKSQLLGIMSAGEARFGPTHAIHGVEQAARLADYLTTHLPATNPAEAEEATQHLLGAGVGGIVVIAPTHQLADQITAHRRNTPVVLLAAGAPVSEGVSVVSVNQELGARLAVRHLAKLGHPLIHHISGPPRWFDAHTRVMGWRTECEALGVEHGLLVEGGWDAADGFAATNTILASGAPLGAIFAANDLLALGAIRALRKRGLSVPEDVSVVGFDDSEGADFYVPSLTTVRQPFALVGRLAIEVLLRMIDGEPASSSSVEPELVVRESTTPARG
nr:LacI family transcriptional regulator [Actinomycetales bacterium]